MLSLEVHICPTVQQQSSHCQVSVVGSCNAEEMGLAKKRDPKRDHKNLTNM